MTAINQHHIASSSFQEKHKMQGVCQNVLELFFALGACIKIGSVLSCQTSQLLLPEDHLGQARIRSHTLILFLVDTSAQYPVSSCVCHASAFIFQARVQGSSFPITTLSLCWERDILHKSTKSTFWTVYSLTLVCADCHLSANLNVKTVVISLFF